MMGSQLHLKHALSVQVSRFWPSGAFLRACAQNIEAKTASYVVRSSNMLNDINMNSLINRRRRPRRPRRRRRLPRRRALGALPGPEPPPPRRLLDAAALHRSSQGGRSLPRSSLPRSSLLRSSRGLSFWVAPLIQGVLDRKIQTQSSGSKETAESRGERTERVLRSEIPERVSSLSRTTSWPRRSSWLSRASSWTGGGSSSSSRISNAPDLRY